MADQEKPVHLDAVEARGGARVGAMRYVLGISLVLIIVIFAVLFMR